VEYLLKSDVMAKFYYSPVALADISTLPTHTFPDPSDAVDGDLISRKGLKDEILSQYPEITVEWDAAFNALLRIINSMPSLPPAPSVDDGKPSEPRTNYSLDSTGKMTDLSKPAPLKLEAGKLYRTRGGKKAFIWYVSGWPERYDYAIQGSGITSCNVHGRNFNDDGRDLDLISLWDEPAPESDTSKLLEMIDKLETAYVNNKPVRTELLDILREIARLLAERGDK